MDLSILVFVVVGFFAQLIDGALGMAYGVSSTTFLLSIGVTPVVASASVHMAEVFTTLVSGLSHLRLGNVDKALFRRLVIPGVVGGVAGAYVLTSIPTKTIKVFVSFYLLLMGIRIVYKAYRLYKQTELDEHNNVETHLVPLAAVGGFFDAVGGGGWGPIVTSTIVARGHNPRLTIGTVNLAEFFVTFAESLTFIALLGVAEPGVILGLIIGGVVAAPLAAYVCSRVSIRMLMTIVGVVIMLLSLKNIYSFFM